MCALHTLLPFNQVSAPIRLVIMTTSTPPTSGDNLRISVQKGLIQLPEDLNTPIICVGPGTGVAPMRSVIEERVDAGSNGTDLCSISDRL